MNATIDREARESAAAIDMLENPAWVSLLNDVAREAKAARSVIFGGTTFDSAEKMGLGIARAQGTLAVLRNIVLEVYRRANREVPPPVAALFE